MIRTRIRKTQRYLIGPCVALAACAIANAQCYQFSGSGVTLRVNITAYNYVQTPVTVAGGRTANYVFSSENTFALGSTTQNSTAILDGQVNIQFLPGSGSNTPDITTFEIVVPDATTTVTKGSGEHSWSALLVGAGDLLPNGIVQVLPPISTWFVPPPSRVNNYIQVASGSSRVKYPITSVSSCANSLIDLAKALGLSCDIPGCVTCGEPINVGTGNVFDSITDYQTAGQNPLSFIRYYNSMAVSATYAVRLGSNWRSNFDTYLRLSASSVIAERPDGQQVTFKLSNGAWTADTDLDYKLSNSGSTWTLTTPKDAVETYNAINANEGLLQSLRARNGYTQTLAYDSSNQLTTVNDSFQRQLSLAYSGGRLSTVTTPDGLILTYGYTGAKLTSVSYSTSPITSQAYLYENTALPNALTGIIDENGNRYITWTYDSTGRGLSSQFAGGADLMKVAYNDSDGSRTVTNALGAQTVYKFTPLQNIPKVTEIDQPATADSPAGVIKYTYDSNGYNASITELNGAVTNFVNDAHGQPTSITEASGTAQARTTSISYHPVFHLRSKIVQPGLTTTYTYDSNGQLLTKTLADTTTTTTPYSTAGQTRTWTYTWSNFLLASEQKPRTDMNAVTSYTYDSSGALTSITNALGQITQVTQHLPGGLPQTFVDPNGVTAELVYDMRLRPLGSSIHTSAGPLTTSNAYDAAGNRTSFTTPDGSSLSSVFDAAHRLTGLTDLLNQSMAITLDALGDRTKTTLLDSSGQTRRTRSTLFDTLGRLSQEVRGAGQITTYAYDASGNTLSITDPLKRITQRSFDPLNRPVKLTDPNKGVTTTASDAFGRPVNVTDPNGSVTTLVYDGFGDLIAYNSPDSGSTVYRYDADGNLTQRVDGAGAVENHSYDALDRLLSTSYPAGPAENVAYTYDGPAAGFGIGRLTSVTDAAGSLARTYDERGDLLTETRISGSATLLTAYTYDGARRVSSVTYPSGWTVSYTRDVMGRITAISVQPPGGSPAIPILSNVTYQPFGPVSAMTYGNGVAETRGFDLDFRIKSLADSGSSPLQNLAYAYDAADNATTIADAVTSTSSQAFTYDVLDRLTSANGAYGSNSYAYDSVGNRLSLGQGGSTTAYSYTLRSNQLASLTQGGASQSIEHTKAGAVSSFSPAAGSVANLTYNQAGHLATVTAGSNPLAQYTYDAFNRRVAKTGSAVTFYQYDRRGLLLEETDGRGNPTVDYIYLDSLPVATISPVDGQVYFLHDDRLGTPQLATDSAQNIVWTASYGPFGELSSTPSLIVQNLRLPGQEFDSDTGLYHNGYRDYAPALGRYLQSDPLGLVGGLNTYAYAGANPVNTVDPLGLFSIKQCWDDVKQFAENEWQREQGEGPWAYCQDAAHRTWTDIKDFWGEYGGVIGFFKAVFGAAEEETTAVITLVKNTFSAIANSDPAFGQDTNSPYYNAHPYTPPPPPEPPGPGLCPPQSPAPPSR